MTGGTVANGHRRLHPLTGRERLHNGIDLAVPVGTPVLAAQAGWVVRVSGGS